MIVADLEEIKRLQQRISSMEKLQTASPSGVSSGLALFINDLKQQLQSLEQVVKLEQEKAQAEQAAAVADAVEREAALDAGEKKTFGDLLQKKFFTKADMVRVDAFYKSSWGKLSDEGKEAMSHRVWEGIRHGELKFSELPNEVKEKEAERLCNRLSGLTAADTLAQIPETDRKDFMQTFESGKKDEAYKILDRQSFTQNVPILASREISGAEIQEIHESDSKQVVSDVASRSENERRFSAENLPSLGAINLKDLKLAKDALQGMPPNSIRADVSTKRSL